MLTLCLYTAALVLRNCHDNTTVINVNLVYKVTPIALRKPTNAQRKRCDACERPLCLRKPGVTGVLYKLQWILSQDRGIFYSGNVFENNFWQTVAILFKPQCVESFCTIRVGTLQQPVMLRCASSLGSVMNHIRLVIDNFTTEVVHSMGEGFRGKKLLVGLLPVSKNWSMGNRCHRKHDAKCLLTGEIAGCRHYSDVTWTSCSLKSPVIPLFV